MSDVSVLVQLLDKVSPEAQSQALFMLHRELAAKNGVESEFLAALLTYTPHADGTWDSSDLTWALDEATGK